MIKLFPLKQTNVNLWKKQTNKNKAQKVLYYSGYWVYVSMSDFKGSG